MTKLSDALRGAADRAPLDGVSIHADVTARRVSRQRGLRGAANGLVGVGAVTLLAVGILAPGMGSGAGDSPAAFDGAGDRNAEGGAEASEQYAMDTGYGMCGAYPGEMAWGEPLVSLTATVEGADGTEFDGGSTVDVTVTTTALDDVELGSEPPAVFVLWDGMVVSQVPWDVYEASEFSLGAGEAADRTVPLELVNCWDSTALPGGKYEVMVTQSFYSVPAEPQPTEPKPDVVPTPEPSPSSDAPGEDVTAPEAITDEPMPIDASGVYFTVSTSAGAIVVAGDVPADPFEKYIPKQLTPDDLPDNYLTPQLASELFLEGVTDEPWNMAAGTSRWVMRESSSEPYDENAWMRNYYGCVWDGTQGSTFPARSAELDLLEYTAAIPSTLSVSYGWVVDGNPLINVEITNTSEYAIPGFYGQPSAEFYLVRDGRIVAEAYPANTDRNGDIGTWAEPAFEGGVDAALENLGLLEPGESLSGEYLWREVNGCWNERGGQELVGPGTYTVLSAQSLYITAGTDAVYYGGMAVEEQAAADGAALDAASSEVRIMPAPDAGAYQYTDLQMWTSLGTVTITN